MRWLGNEVNGFLLLVEEDNLVSGCQELTTEA
jgi:hypothetical protein